MVTFVRRKNVFEKASLEGPLFSYDGINVFLNKDCLSLLKINSLSFQYCQVLVDKNFPDNLWIRPCSVDDWGARKVHYLSLALKNICYRNVLQDISFRFENKTKNFYSVKWDDSVKSLCGTFLKSNKTL